MASDFREGRTGKFFRAGPDFPRGTRARSRDGFRPAPRRLPPQVRNSNACCRAPLRIHAPSHEGLTLGGRWGAGAARRLGERRGIDPLPRPRGELVWVHAASVGETVSILPVLQQLAAASPGPLVLLTTGTVTSSVLLNERLPELGLRERVLQRFVPLDVPRWAGRFLDHWRPQAAVFVESELWPNLLAGCAKRDIPVVLLNARMSARSYARWQKAPRTARAVLGAFHHVAARSAQPGRICRTII